MARESSIIARRELAPGNPTVRAEQLRFLYESEYLTWWESSVQPAACPTRDQVAGDRARADGIRDRASSEIPAAREAGAYPAKDTRTVQGASNRNPTTASTSGKSGSEPWSTSLTPAFRPSRLQAEKRIVTGIEGTRRRFRDGAARRFNPPRWVVAGATPAASRVTEAGAGGHVVHGPIDSPPPGVFALHPGA